MKQGQEVVVNLKNELQKNVTIHWHGYPVPSEMDGVPGVSQNSIKPGQTFTYKFKATVPGTYWYHSHVDSVHQIDKGLYGAFIVEKKDEPQVNKDYTVILDEWETGTSKNTHSMNGMDHSQMQNMSHGDMGNMSSDGMNNMSGDSMQNMSQQQMESKMNMDHMASYNLFTVNGKSGSLIEPVQVKTGDKVKLRFINAGYQLRLMDFGNVSYKVVATDGQDIQQPADIKNKLLPVAPGERYDVEFIVPSTSFAIMDRTQRPAAKDIKILVKNQDNNQVAQSGQMNSQLFDVTNYGKGQIEIPKKFNKQFKMVFQDVMDPSSDMGMKYTINGKSFPNTEPLNVNKNEWVKVTFENKGQANHPMHLHGHSFIVLSKNGVPLKGSPIIKDTLNVKPNETFEIAFHATNPGDWMFHCHDLHHASTGMATVVHYVGYKTPAGVDKAGVKE
ncbi:multicopper oxidase family protein [Aneurinibacillus sp. Ricciae_BoGa-3]|uniref:multicopper oxidase family protein n=1 Tax=Aneurinibacillus sp. Ricciae_BoGa-3 TaxID=3022697 RepID=UPI002341F5FA|nr:multicopper oxidase family protein [Aneurinibacillus sp. Ricciae_BoGa-3]WCK54824.1 multicopper oxidase family protein [Aneurinibacillus sp. Ricciae_BoGa-3]